MLAFTIIHTKAEACRSFGFAKVFTSFDVIKIVLSRIPLKIVKNHLMAPLNDALEAKVTSKTGSQNITVTSSFYWLSGYSRFAMNSEQNAMKESDYSCCFNCSGQEKELSFVPCFMDREEASETRNNKSYDSLSSLGWVSAFVSKALHTVSGRVLFKQSDLLATIELPWTE